MNSAAAAVAYAAIQVLYAFSSAELWRRLCLNKVYDHDNDDDDDDDAFGF